VACALARRSVIAHPGEARLEREVFGLVHIQGLTHAEAAELLKVSTKTIQRRLNRSILLLKRELDDLRPTDGGEGADGR
jgi:RNA polymerase sigma-70 factor (ECF subfamily)